MEAMKVTKEDIAAIRAATSFGVRFQNGQVSLRLRKAQPKRADGFSGDDLERAMHADCPKYLDASFWMTYPGGAWTALGLILRPGDELVFHCRENGNGYTRAARIPAGVLDTGESYDALYWDELTVEIGRHDKSLVRDLVLHHSFTPANSARAIRHESNRYSLV